MLPKFFLLLCNCATQPTETNVIFTFTSKWNSSVSLHWFEPFIKMFFFAFIQIYSISSYQQHFAIYPFSIHKACHCKASSDIANAICICTHIDCIVNFSQAFDVYSAVRGDTSRGSNGFKVQYNACKHWIYVTFHPFFPLFFPQPFYMIHCCCCVVVIQRVDISSKTHTSAHSFIVDELFAQLIPMGV